MFEIVYNNISQKYHMVEKENPKGTSFGVGETIEDCFEDSKVLLGPLKEVGENIFTKEVDDDELYKYHKTLCGIYEKKFLNCKDDKTLYHLSKDFTNRKREILGRIDKIYLRQLVQKNHQMTLNKGQARMLELHTHC